MDLLELLFAPIAVVGCLFGLALAVLVHWLGPKPEPVILEGALVALGFVGGFAVEWISDRRAERRRKAGE